jgi:hypothetical protein
MGSLFTAASRSAAAFSNRMLARSQHSRSMLRVANRRVPRPRTYFTTSNGGPSARKRDGPRRFPRQPPPLPACRSARGHDGIVGGARSGHIEIDRRSIDCSVDGTHLTELDRAMSVSATACSRRCWGRATAIGLGGSGVVPGGIGRELYCSIRSMKPGPPLMLSELASGGPREGHRGSGLALQTKAGRGVDVPA